MSAARPATGSATGIHVGPSSDEYVERIEDAVRRCGGRVCDLADAHGVIWTSSSATTFPRQLPEQVRWVQLPMAGVDGWLQTGLLDRGLHDERIWTTAAGAYAESVAEHALMLLIAGVRQLPACLAASTWQRTDLMPTVHSLRNSTVAIVGCGAIGCALIPSLHSLGAEVLAVTHSGRPVDGARITLPASDVGQVWAQADHVVLAAPATAQTHHLVGGPELAAMKSTAWLVNVARGSLVDTHALTVALAAGQIGGAALDVTDPEPLPDGHPLWQEPRAVITPHLANPIHALRAALLLRVEENTARFLRGKPLVGVVDFQLGY